jgi:hypothetical protein
MYSWFIDLYVLCTGYNLYKTLPECRVDTRTIDAVGKKGYLFVQLYWP